MSVKQTKQTKTQEKKPKVVLFRSEAYKNYLRICVKLQLVLNIRKATNWHYIHGI